MAAIMTIPILYSKSVTRRRGGQDKYYERPIEITIGDCGKRLTAEYTV